MVDLAWLRGSIVGLGIGPGVALFALGEEFIGERRPGLMNCTMPSSWSFLRRHGRRHAVSTGWAAEVLGEARLGSSPTRPEGGTETSTRALVGERRRDDSHLVDR